MAEGGFLVESLNMIIFLYGADTFRSRQKLNEIIEHYKKVHKNGLNLRFWDLEEKNLRDLKDETQTISMFDEKKLSVLRNASANKKFQEEFLENQRYFLNSKDIFLFLEEKKPESNQFFKFLGKKEKVQEFKPLDGIKLKTWVKKEFEKYGAKVEPAALEKLIEFVGNDLWQMENEIEKLVNFKKRTGVIKEEDVEILVKSKIETAIFDTIDAVAQRDKKRAIELIHKHLENGDSPLYLLSMINFQFRNLLMIKDLIEKGRPYYTFPKITKLHPFVIKKSYSQAARFNLPELKKIYRRIFQADLDIKTGKLEPQTALDLFVAAI
jgi:DNA polymerase-3 subunit delta